MGVIRKKKNVCGGASGFFPMMYNHDVLPYLLVNGGTCDDQSDSSKEWDSEDGSHSFLMINFSGTDCDSFSGSK